MLLKVEILSQCTLETDAGMLSTIMDNLVSNGVRYGESGTRLVLRLTSKGLEIQNNGHIPEGIAEHLFEPFVSGNTGNKSHGLGLYIVSYYAGLLDMTVTVQNAGELVVTEICF